MITEKLPWDRCGFVLEPDDVDSDVTNEYEPGSDEWYENIDAVCCWRKVWSGGNGSRCIWHAKKDDKPVAELIEARADQYERLDGAYISTTRIGNTINFDNCGMVDVNFDGTEATQLSCEQIDGRYIQVSSSHFLHPQFPNAELRHAQFHDVTLPNVRFRNTDLREACFTEAVLNTAWFGEADLRHTQFTEADLKLAFFPDANLRGAQFTNSRLLQAQFPRADLQGAQFSDVDLSEADFTNANLKNTTFEKANTEDANFDGANLAGTELDETSEGGIGNIATWVSAVYLALDEAVEFLTTENSEDPTPPQTRLGRLGRQAGETVARVLHRLRRTCEYVSQRSRGAISALLTRLLSENNPLLAERPSDKGDTGASDGDSPDT